ncbi:MAG: hypothetical protein R3C03_23875 [Pirellulaceae bacterium]
MWHRSANNEFAFGWWKDAPPKPTDFLKDEVIPGETVNGWLIPRIRKQHLIEGSIKYTTQLPKKPKFDGNRFVDGPVCERFHYLLPLAEQVFEMCFDAYRDGVIVTDAASLAAKIIQVNHAIGHDEMAVMEAFEMSLDSVIRFLEVFVSFADYVSLVSEVQKKSPDIEPSDSENTLSAV